MISTVSTSASPTAKADDDAALKKAAQAFEAIFLRQMIGSMRTASLGDDLFDSSATDQFRDMADAKTAETMSQQSGLGIADLLVKQFAARTSSAAPTEAVKP